MRPQIISVLVFAGTVWLASMPRSLATQAELIQAEKDAPLRFEAASLKLAADQSIIESRPKRAVGRFHFKTYLLNLLSYAYHVEWWRISGAPGLNTVYELEATTRPNTAQDQVRVMLRSLLIERFQLETHYVTKNDVEGYAVNVAKGGAKLQDAKPRNSDAGSPDLDDGYVFSTLPTSDTMTLRGHNTSMWQLSEFLERQLGTHVLDQSGMTGRYDFDLTCSRDEAEHSPNSWANCVKQLGLALGKYKGPVEFLVIDHLGKLVEN